MKYTLTQLRKDYPNDEACLDKIFQIRFANLKCCPQCQSETKFHRVEKRMCYECQHCGYQIFPLAGTPLEKTRTNLTKWFHAIHMMTTTRNGVAAKEIERVLGVTYKCAWRMMHQIREVMSEGTECMLSGCVQSDETLIGGVQRRKEREENGDNKTTVFGMVQEGGKVIMKKVEDRKRKTLLPIIEKYVDKGTHITTDELPSYKVLGAKGYTHSKVNHNKEEYVNEDGKHTNTIEGVWSLLKRAISSTHVWVSDTHLPKYLNEFEFRYNHREKSAPPMFNTILSNLSLPLCKVDKETGEVITVYQEQRA